MARFFKRTGSETVEIMSEERTASPNVWWSIEQMRSHGFTECQPDAAALKALAISEFDVREFTDRLNVEFSGAELVALAPYYAVLKDQVAFPSFESAKVTLQALLGAGILSQEGYGKISAILLEQNINLEDF